MQKATTQIKRKVVPTLVAGPAKKKAVFTPDSMPEPLAKTKAVPVPVLAPAPTPLPEQNSNPAEAVAAAAAAPKTFEKVDVYTTYPERVELAVPYGERDVVKAAKCLWWPEERIWFAPQRAGFEDIIDRYQGEYLCIDKESKDEAKAKGAIFRPQSVTWFGPAKDAGEVFGCVYFTKATFEDKTLLKMEGARWSPFFRCWYTSRRNFLANPTLESFV